MENRFINKCIPIEVQRQLVTPFFLAYSSFETITSQFPITMGPMQKNYLTRMKHAFVQHEIERLIKSNVFKGAINCRDSNNCNNTHPFIELYNSDFIATVSYVKKSSMIPQNVKYRNDRSANNQLPLFEEDLANPDKLYFILTHGSIGLKPDFVCIGLPRFDNKCWVEKTNILNLPYIVPSKQEKEESLVSLTPLGRELIKNIKEDDDQ